MGSPGERSRDRRAAASPSAAGHLVLVGANHRTAPLEERERLLARATYPRLRTSAGRTPPWTDLVLLTTCNRIEAYAVAGEPRAAEAAIAATFGMPVTSPSLYVLEDEDAAAHLLRVASGLDSLAQGEGQITAQVRRAPSERPASWRRSDVLEGFFGRAARLAPRIRELAGVPSAGTSASHAAIRFIEQAVPVPRPSVALLGSGKMARLAAGALQGRATLLILSRNASRAREAAARTGARSAGLRELREALERADVLIAATSAPKPILTEPFVRAAVAKRAGRPLWLADLGFPRNVAGACASLPGVTLIDIDGLAPWGAAPLPPAGIARGEARIRDQAVRLLDSLHPDVRLDVAEFRRTVEEFRRREVQEALARMPDLSEADRAVVDKLASRLVNRMLHGPTERMRALPDDLRARFLEGFVSGLKDVGGGPR